MQFSQRMVYGWSLRESGSSIKTLLLCSLLLTINLPKVAPLGCFVCSSINGSEPDCEDTFNNTGRFYEQHCMAGRDGRAGKFPGTACIKMTAELNDYRVIVRTCAVDSGGTNSETELGRESHCWMVNEVRWNDKKMNGCSVACSTDGCNSASSVSTSVSMVIAITSLGLWLGQGYL